MRYHASVLLETVYYCGGQACNAIVHWRLCRNFVADPQRMESACWSSSRDDCGRSPRSARVRTTAHRQLNMCTAKLDTIQFIVIFPSCVPSGLTCLSLFLVLLRTFLSEVVLCFGGGYNH
jgi:hypothetical protein